jgi:zinc transport system substrate-binding protein
MRTVMVIAIGVLLAALASCGRGSAPAVSDAELRIATTVPPLEWIARGLAPDGTPVSTLLPPGASEHGYEPPPSRLADFVRADVVLMVGLGLEPAADRALRSSPRGGRSIVVFAEAAGVTGEMAESHAGHDHTDPDHSHTHDASGLDPHLWLDPPRMLPMIDATHDALARQLQRRGASDGEIDTLASRRDALRNAVERVDAAYRERLGPYAGGAIVSAHDSMRRLADRYGLRVVGVVHTHEGAEPTPGEIVRAAQALRNATHRAILIEPQSGRSVAERLVAETGAPVATFDPLGSGDWETTMLTNLDALVQAFSDANR